jgi:hypothetical protein
MRAHDIIVLRAEGRWSGPEEWAPVGPDGFPPGEGPGHQVALDPVFPVFALIGGIGRREQPFAVGQSLFLFVGSEGEGTLQLRPNIAAMSLRGEMAVQGLQLRFPWFVRTILGDAFKEIAPQIGEIRAVERECSQALADGKIGVDEARAKIAATGARQARWIEAQDIGWHRLCWRWINAGIQKKLRAGR